MRPGAIPSEIYRSILDSLDDAFLEDFMGFQSQQVRFLGHGVGLHFDEYPVLAEGFEEPLKENMVLAVEPKKGMAGIGLVGLENTFRVTPAGGVSLTGTKKDLFVVET
jgi:Xaa-Pro aminopeptidase